MTYTTTINVLRAESVNARRRAAGLDAECHRLTRQAINVRRERDRLIARADDIDASLRLMAANGAPATLTARPGPITPRSLLERLTRALCRRRIAR